MRNLKLIIAYKGTRYLGWQNTKQGPSIEGSLQAVLEKILQHQVSLQAASRTDAGVHAIGQVVNFLTHHPITTRRLKKSLNGMLPNDISVYSIEEKNIDFHPTLDARGKEYNYFLCNGKVQLPFHRDFSWHFPYPLDFSAMDSAIQHLIGTQDFSALTNEQKENNVRTVGEIKIERFPDQRVMISVSGNHFLYKMVRNLVGMILYVGVGKLASAEIPTILNQKKRSHAGVTAPAHGLYLKKVYYGTE